MSRCVSTARQQPPSAGSFGELEELGFRQFPGMQSLCEEAETIILDVLPAVGLYREVDDFRLQIERL
jgi:hypothetical protein